MRIQLICLLIAMSSVSTSVVYAGEGGDTASAVSNEFLNDMQRKVVIRSLDEYAMDVLEEESCSVFFDDLRCSSASCVLKYHYNQCGDLSNRATNCLLTGVSSFEQLNSQATDLFQNVCMAKDFR